MFLVGYTLQHECIRIKIQLSKKKEGQIKRKQKFRIGDVKPEIQNLMWNGIR